VLFLALALTPLGWAIYKEWPALQESLHEVAWGAFASSLILYVLVIFSIGVVPWVAVRSLGVRFSFLKVSIIYFFTQALKYLPGGLWALPGRMAAYRLLGVERARAIIGVFREATILFLGAACVGFLGLVLQLPVSDKLRVMIGVGALGSAGIILLTHVPGFWRFLSTFRFLKPLKVETYVQVDSEDLGWGWIVKAFLASGAFWLLMGLPFRMLAIAVAPSAAAMSWLEAASIFALAWCAGAFVVFAPAGIGVREAALSFLLTHVMPIGSALSLAVLSRIAWVIAEGFWVLATWLWAAGRPEFSLRRIRQLVEE
jgi:hypothetical protein